MHTMPTMKGMSRRYARWRSASATAVPLTNRGMPAASAKKAMTSRRRTLWNGLDHCARIVGATKARLNAPAASDTPIQTPLRRKTDVRLAATTSALTSAIGPRSTYHASHSGLRNPRSHRRRCAVGARP
jgi:hypothetical protein